MEDKMEDRDGGVNVDDGGSHGKTTEQSEEEEQSRSPTFKNENVSLSIQG